MENEMDRAEIVLEPDPVIEAYRRDIDLGLICSSLRLTVEQRFEELMRLQEFAEELQKAGSQQESK